jgi:PAS domain S-box-containing protein
MNNPSSETNQLYWRIFETAADGMLIVDLETGSLLAVNPAAAEMHGYEREALSGPPLQTLVHAKSLPAFAEFSQVIRRGEVFETQVQHVRRDESLLRVEWRAVAFDYQGRDSALALLRDVSGR